MLTAIVMLAFAFYSTASQAVVTSITVTSANLSKSTGAITVTGTVVCTAGDVFSVFTQILQVSGGNNGVTLGFQPSALCSGSVDTWIVSNNTVQFGSIKNGNALVIVEGVDVNDGTFDQPVFHQPVNPAP
jgi:hypothetical protein